MEAKISLNNLSTKAFPPQRNSTAYVLQDKLILKCYIKLKPKKICIEQRQERQKMQRVRGETTARR